MIMLFLFGFEVCEFVGIGTVAYDLTFKEHWQYVVAVIKALRHPDSCVADWLSPELEAVVCGCRPERYKLNRA